MHSVLAAQFVRHWEREMFALYIHRQKRDFFKSCDRTTNINCSQS